MSPEDRKLLEKICKADEKNLLKALYDILKANYSEVVLTDEYCYAVGGAPIILAAHVDTVFKIPPMDIFYDEEKGVLWSPEGLGADDRAGVFAIIKILQAGYRPSVIFSTGEETGGIGARALIKDCPNCIDKNAKYIIQIDRQGDLDCVFYDCDNPDFENYVEKFGFKTKIGSFTDICIYCPQWKIAGVNLATGYLYEHSASEHLYVDILYDTIAKIKNMIDASKDLKEPFKYIPCKYPFAPVSFTKTTDTAGTRHSYSYDYGYSYPYENDYYEDEDTVCEVCGRKFYDFETFGVQDTKGNIKIVCSDCLGSNIQWCDNCYGPFELDPANLTETLCPDCRGVKYGTRRTKTKNKLFRY